MVVLLVARLKPALVRISAKVVVYTRARSPAFRDRLTPKPIQISLYPRCYIEEINKLRTFDYAILLCFFDVHGFLACAPLSKNGNDYSVLEV